MNAPVFKAAYCDVKPVKTRQTVQFIFEVPATESYAAMALLGGFPNPAAEVWVGIARLEPTAIAHKAETAAIAPPQRDSESSKERRPFADLSPQQQAGIICNEPVFKLYLKENHHWTGFAPADFVRDYCGVESRSELATNERAKLKWNLLASSYLAWRNVLV